MGNEKKLIKSISDTIDNCFDYTNIDDIMEDLEHIQRSIATWAIVEATEGEEKYSSLGSFLDGMLSSTKETMPYPEMRTNPVSFMRKPEDDEKRYKNKCRCKKCGDVIESKSRHDFVWCKCRSIFTDGGQDYIRRGGLLDDIEHITEEL